MSMDPKDCEPGMHKCGNCKQGWTCESSPYAANDREIDQHAWARYVMLRSAMCSLKEERYADVFEALHPGHREDLQNMGMTDKMAGEFMKDMMQNNIMGLERVHRTLLKLIENGTVRILEKGNEPCRD